MSAVKVPYVNFPAQYEAEKEAIDAAVRGVFERGDFVGGAAVGQLEKALANYIGVKHVVALASGTDALILGMRALGIGSGDEVITPPNSFVASTAAIAAIGATPVFADIGEDGNFDPLAVEKAVTGKTKAIMPVHLTGRIAPMIEIEAIAKERGLLIIEDAAQSIGSKLSGRSAGTFGYVGCFSTHPLKNLNAAGDAGFLTTDDGDIAETIGLLRNHGLKDRDTVVHWGTVSRLDTIQAAILLHRLANLDEVIAKRRTNAALYRDKITAPQIKLPRCKNQEFNTFHTFVVQTENRDDLKTYLSEHGIETAIHYPTPIHLQPAAQSLGYHQGDFPVCERQCQSILSLPIHQYLSEADVTAVADRINSFYGA
jgi:dTDP-4-amino-4,6-dideoxygalactose transaminase